METTHHHEAHHIVPYRTYVIILAILLLFTSISVVTHIELDGLTIAIALGLATLKSLLVLFYFMHLKFDDIILRIMVIAVFLVLALVIFITLLDYIYR